MSEGQGLLAGYRVLDLADEKGLFCGKLLSDLGADVVKVEPPGGGPARNIGPFADQKPGRERGLFWAAYNAGKRSITLDIHHADGQGLLKRLAATADFLVESFQPGVMDRLGLGYREMERLNPALVYTSITPYGQSGPHSHYQATDLTLLASGGFLFMCGDEDRPPVRIAAEQAYLLGGLHATVGTLMAHHYRQATGEGQRVDVSIQESVMWSLNYPVPYWASAHQLFRRSGTYQQRLNVRHRRIYPCKDGYVSYGIGVGLVLGPMQKRLVDAMAEEGLAGDLAEADWGAISVDLVPQETMSRWEAVMARYFEHHTKAELDRLALERELFLSTVNTAKDIMSDSHLKERDYWRTIGHPQAGKLTYPGPFFRSPDAAWQCKRPAPRVGEHNREVYEGELGLTAEEMAILRELRVI